MEKNYIEVRPYDGENYEITWDNGTFVGGHSGSDQGLMHDVFLVFNGEEAGGVSFIDVSMDSHIMSFAAEESRLNNGKTMTITK